MTRAQMVARVKNNGGEWGGTPGGLNPLLLDEEVVEACNQMAAECYGYYQQQWIDIEYIDDDDHSLGIAYQYQMPANVVNPKKIFVNDNSPTPQLKALRKLTPQGMDRKYGTVWRNASTAATGVPCNWVQWAANSFILYPRPDYVTTCKTGIVIEGYYTPGKQWDATIPEDDPGQADAECPLPASCHWGVVWKALIIRQIETFNPDVKARVEFYESQYKTYRDDLEIKSASITEAMRNDNNWADEGSYIYIGGAGS